jgi:hypothetical protein
MTKGWYMPVGSTRFHWFSGTSYIVNALCGRHRASAREVLGNEERPDKLGCAECLRRWDAGKAS